MRERPLFDREREREQITALVARARSGAGGALFVVGPPGIGKSRLLDEALQLGHDAGLRVLEARAHPLEQDFAFAVVRQLFDAMVQAPDGSRLLHGPAAPAAALFANEALPEAGSGDGLYPLLHGLFWLAANAADERPLLLVCDDAQWADIASLRFLAYLVHRLADVKVAVVVAMRPGDVAPTSELLEELGSHRSIEVIEPAQLGADGVEQLVRDALPEATDGFCQACRQATNGNPFLVVELLRATIGSLTGSDADIEHVARLAPRTIARSVLGRLGRLADAATDVAQAVAVLGGSVDLTLVATVSGRTTDEVADVLDDLVRADVLERVGDEIQFIHGVVSQAVLNEVSPGLRSELDFRAAEVLQQRGAAAPQIGAHLLGTPGRGNRWAVDALRATAARASSEGVPETALRYLRRAVAEGCRDPEVSAELHFDLGAAGALLGEVDAAHHLETAAAGLTGARALDALTAAARAHAVAGRRTDAGRCFDEALALDPDRLQRAAIEIERAMVLATPLPVTLLGGSGTPIDTLVADLPRLQPLGPLDRARLLQHATESFRRAGPASQVVAMARRAYDGGRLLHDPLADSVGVSSLASLLSGCGEFDEAITVLDEAVAHARLRGSAMGLATALHCRSWALLHAGRLPEARTDIDAVLEASASGWALCAGAAAVSATLHLERSEVDAARAALAGSAERVVPGGDPIADALLAGVNGDLAMASDDPASAVELYREAGRSLRGAGVESPALFPWRSRAAAAELALGAGSAARTLVDAELEVATQTGIAHSIATARLALATLSAPAEALALAEAAGEVLTNGPAVLVQLRALTAQGTALRLLDRRDEAADRLRSALDVAQRIGAQAIADLALAELQAAGYRPRRGARRGVDALTPSERRVADLAAAGHSNREIADQLFVTVKTVEFHLGNTFTKCEVRSRGELAALLESSDDDDALVPTGRSENGAAAASPAPSPPERSPRQVDTRFN